MDTFSWIAIGLCSVGMILATIVATIAIYNINKNGV